MSHRAEALPVSFTANERELIRHEMGIHFGQYPSLADGIFLRTWRGGPQKSEPENPAGGAHDDGRNRATERTGSSILTQTESRDRRFDRRPWR